MSPRPAAVLFLLLALLCGCATAPTVASDDSSLAANRAVGKLAGFRADSEEAASIIKNDKKLSDEQRQHAEILYMNARASIEAFTAQVKLDIGLGYDLQDLVTRNQEAFSAAVNDGQAFVTFVNQQYAHGSITTGEMTLIGDAYKIISGAVSDIRAFISAEDTQREKRMKSLSDALDAVRWKPFAEATTSPSTAEKKLTSPTQ